ncbi:hypothetical protein [Reyranella sp.]|jgi:hypothetical protein|uniref:hypothetical protein n=1 Tax=Reyranella sp. TaxID=1929291 RepID=UPI002606F09C|nr:hypothetical protein [Reyranella sp.]HQS14996.1 hypothetical protein [Reyranella sp.]HQT10805.1 hypothetical protein [Reyranella sp.]
MQTATPADVLANEAAGFLANERLMSFSGRAARMATRSALAELARDLGIPEADIEAAVDQAIKTADER